MVSTDDVIECDKSVTKRSRNPAKTQNLSILSITCCLNKIKNQQYDHVMFRISMCENSDAKIEDPVTPKSKV